MTQGEAHVCSLDYTPKAQLSGKNRTAAVAVVGLELVWVPRATFVCRDTLAQNFLFAPIFQSPGSKVKPHEQFWPMKCEWKGSMSLLDGACGKLCAILQAPFPC